MGMAAVLCAGADVWLNNPIRPQEASGTSGMKAALNGGLNLSISDGWWDELYDGHDGWTIPTADGVGDDNRRDDLEAAALYDLVEKRVAPLFYRRNESACRRAGWTPCGTPWPIWGRGCRPPGWCATTSPGTTARRPCTPGR